jgi:HPr kinase/phosphorylase
MAMPAMTVHASAVLVGARAVMIRGPSGSGKSRLAFDLIEAGRAGALRFARLVADDRVYLEVANGALVARPVEALAGLIEIRGVGLLRMAHEPAAVVGHVIDLAAADATRLPETHQRMTEIGGIIVPRLAVAPAVPPLSHVLALLNSLPDNWV